MQEWRGLGRTNRDDSLASWPSSFLSLPALEVHLTGPQTVDPYPWVEITNNLPYVAKKKDAPGDFNPGKVSYRAAMFSTLPSTRTRTQGAAHMLCRRAAGGAEDALLKRFGNTDYALGSPLTAFCNNLKATSTIFQRCTYRRLYLPLLVRHTPIKFLLRNS
eukprot:scaffold65954_cov47-Prasinocladus_malaysianus.AAC.8